MVARIVFISNFINKLESIKNAAEWGFSGAHRSNPLHVVLTNPAKGTVYKFINPGMLGANQPTNSLSLGEAPLLLLWVSSAFAVATGHAFTPSIQPVLSSVHGWMLILGTTVQQRRRAVSGTGTGGGTG